MAPRKGNTVTDAFKTVKKAYINLAAHVNYLNCINPTNYVDADDDDDIAGLDDPSAEAFMYWLNARRHMPPAKRGRVLPSPTPSTLMSIFKAESGSPTNFSPQA